MDTTGLFTRRQFSLLSAASVFSLLGQKRVFAIPSSDAKQPASYSLATIFPLTAKTTDSFATLMAYDPSLDPDAVFFRSKIPRAPRIAPFAATQAHPSLSPLPQLATLTGCYRTLGAGSEDPRYTRQRYGISPEDGVYASRMISYHDIMVSWNGPGMIPNPAMTDAAHRNGAFCLGTIFQPDHRIFDSSAVPAQQVAAKFVELAIFFGFDGYFMNFEMGTPQGHQQVLELLALMHKEARRQGKSDFYIQFYDGSTDMAQLMPLNASSEFAPKSSFADSTMLDQGWSGYNMTHGCCSGRQVDPTEVYAYCTANGLDPYRSAYFGYQLYPGPGYFSQSAPTVIHPNDSTYAYGSLQIYSFDDGLYTMQQAMHRHAAVLASAHERQEQYYALERSFFSGQSQNPALDNAPNAAQADIYAQTAAGKRRYTDYSPTVERTSDQVRLPITYGVANFTVERSVIGSFPFLTHFNLGSGESFFIEGVKRGMRPWFNLGIQDLLPTWQWWMEPMDRPLERCATTFAPLDVKYDQATAFDGGASLHVSGVLRESVALRLYKTKLAVSDADKLSLQIVWQGIPETKQHLSFGLIFEDASDKPVWIRFADRQSMSHQSLVAGWTRSSIALTAYKGRTIAAFLLGFHHGLSRQQTGIAQTAIDLHVGEIYAGITAQVVQPPPPSGFIGKVHLAESGRLDARLRWDSSEMDAHYDIFSTSGSEKNWLGRVSADCYYAEDIPATPGQPIIFELVANSLEMPLTHSKPAQTAIEAL